jgi:hypothetical protein
MQSKKIIAAGVLALGLALAPRLEADVQGRLNVVANALASATDIQVQILAVAGFTDGAGQRPPFAAELEADLRQALGPYSGQWKVLGADEKTSKADGLLTGTFQRSGADILVHVELLAEPDGAILWQRNAILDASDVSDADLPLAPAVETADADDEGQAGDTVPETGGAPAEDQVVPAPSWRPERHDYYGGCFDLSVAYQAFLPTNSRFENVAGGVQNALSFGLSINDVFLADMAFWQQNVSNLGTATSLSYAGTDVALVYPFHLGDNFTLYVGPGGRFGEISVQDPALTQYTDFGNNALTAVAGAKFVADHVGLDLRYSGDLVYSYMAYNTIRLGAFYEFGR